MSAARGPWAGRSMHFIGVGGAGMSAYARAAFALGANVSGSDSTDTPYLARLQSDGILEAGVGYAAANLPAGAEIEVFHSSAVPPENPERVAARERGLPVRPRADVLGELSALRRTIAVAGTHGKTTTSAMIVHALRGGGADPGWMIGGTIGAGLANAHWSESEWLVVEADESDRSMLSLKVEIAVLTNAELDHHAAYASLAQLMEAYAQFLAGAPQAVIWERPQLLSLREGPRVSYDVSSPRLHPGGSCFTWRGHEVRVERAGCPQRPERDRGRWRPRAWPACGRRTRSRGSHAHRGRQALSEAWPHRLPGRSWYDDYAHHPTEVRATIAAARTELADGRGRLMAVFQPHLFSRTALLAGEFGRGARERRSRGSAGGVRGPREPAGPPRCQRSCDRAAPPVSTPAGGR